MLRHLPYHSNYQECARIVKFYAVLARRGALAVFARKPLAVARGYYISRLCLIGHRELFAVEGNDAVPVGWR